MSGRRPDGPVRRVVNVQGWTDLTFLHWRYEPAVVQRLLPPGLQVQVLDGSAWLGVTPFRMTRVRLPGLPPVPRWSTFPEVNVRTYVTGPDGLDGIRFLSLDCPRRGIVLGMRAVAVPYVLADGRLEVVRPGSAAGGRTVRYRFSRRVWPRVARAGFDATVQVGESLGERDRSPLVDSLTGRWGTYVHRLGRWWRIPVDHPVWPLHPADADGDLTRLIVAAGLPEPAGPPLVHFSPGVEARIGAPAPIGRGAVGRSVRPA